MAELSGSSTSPASHPPKFLGWRMVARGFLCQNVATGFAFGGCGVTLMSVQERYDASRALAALGISLTVLTMSLVAPAVAGLLMRFGVRRTMIAGILLGALGYAGLAAAPNIALFLAACALFIGPSIALFGPFPCSILAGSWFVEKQGRAVGLVNVPLLVPIIPLIGVGILESYGLSVFFAGLAAGHLLLLPVAATVIDRPEDVGQRALGALEAGIPQGEAAAPPKVTARQLLTRPAFWVVVAGSGALSALGVAATSQLVAMGAERGLESVQAGLLITFMGGASIVGSLVVGALCDRVGAACALVLAAAVMGLGWAALLTGGPFAAMAASVMLLGLAGGGVFPATTVLTRHLFGEAALARALGLFTLLGLPLLFGVPPAVALLREVTGRYEPVMAIMAASCAGVMLAYLGLWRAEARRVKRGVDAAQLA